MNVCTLVPDYVEDNHPQISSLEVGILFAMYQLFIMILAPILGDYCAVIGRRKTIIYGFVIVSLATVVFAMASLFEDDKVFYTVSIVARSL